MTAPARRRLSEASVPTARQRREHASDLRLDERAEPGEIRQRQVRQPDTAVRVPAKPALITAANVAVLGALGVVAAPLAGLAAVAVTGAGVGSIAARRGRTRRAHRAGPLLGGPVRRPGGIGMPRRRVSTGGIRLPRLGRAAPLMARRRIPTSAPFRRGMVGRPLSAAGRMAKAVRAGQQAGTARAAAAQARRAATANRGPVRRAVGGLGAAGLAAGAVAARNGWRLARRLVRHRILGHPQPARPTRPGTQRPTPAVKPTVSRGPAKPTTGPVAPAKPVPRPVPGPPVIPLAAVSGTTKENTTMGYTRELAGKMWAHADAWTPRGMLEPVEEYHDLPYTLGFVRAAIGALMEKSAKKFPVDQAIARQLGQIVGCLDTAAEMAKKIPEAVETIHGDELKRLRNPRQGERMWDLSANGL